MSGKVLWDNKVDGNITKVNVNRNGNVSVITRGTSYKSVVFTYDKSGKELFKTYLATTIAVSTDISSDGKYLAIAEVNIGGAVIESSIKIIEIEKASHGDATNSVIYKYSADSNKIIAEIKYQEKGILVCKYDDSIHIISDDKDTLFKEFDSNVQIADINLKGHTVLVQEKSSGIIGTKTDVIFTNLQNNTDSVYSLDNSIKKLVSYEQIVAVNVGTEVHFVGLNGWIEKKYSSVQEIKEIVLGTYIAGIIYRDRIKIITF